MVCVCVCVCQTQQINRLILRPTISTPSSCALFSPQFKLRLTGLGQNVTMTERKPDFITLCSPFSTQLILYYIQQQLFCLTKMCGFS